MVLSESQGIMFMNVQTGEPIIAPSSTDHPLYDQIVEACRTVHDPEIPVNIYDLGLIYRISIDGEGNVEVDMTLTAPAVPTGMKAGVRISPRGVVIRPRRARPSRESI